MTLSELRQILRLVTIRQQEFQFNWYVLPVHSPTAEQLAVSLTIRLTVVDIVVALLVLQATIVCQFRQLKAPLLK